jgi:hypothetical protein
MTKDDRELIERLRGLLAKASDLPWEVYVPEDGTGAACVKRVTDDADGSRRTDWPAVCNCNTLPNADNAALIVEAVNNLPALLTRLEALQAQPVGERSPELVEVIREWLASIDHTVSDWECQFAEAIRSMMRASGWIEPNALSTPVAQGDEVRDALSTAFEIVDMAPELNMSNYDHDDVVELNNAMIEVHQFLLATLTKGARDAG